MRKNYANVLMIATNINGFRSEAVAGFVGFPGDWASLHQCGCGESLAATRGRENRGIFVVVVVGLSQM